MCEKYCDDRGFLWRSVGLPEVAGGEVMREIDTEKWLSSLFSELIRRGIDSDEHLHFKDSPLGGSYAPSLDELKESHLGYTGEFLTELLQEHLDRILQDYKKLEER